MFRFRRPDAAGIQTAMAAAETMPLSAGQSLSVRSGLRNDIPFTFSHDYNLAHLGQGREAFVVARLALARWTQFDLGWVEVLNPRAPLEVGTLVGVLVRTAGLWTLNFSRIVDTVDTETHFGFLYATTPLHVEEGEERFIIEFDPVTKAVSYLLEAVSRPRDVLAQLGYPFTRAMQHRFARDSQLRMRRAVQEAATLKI